MKFWILLTSEPEATSCERKCLQFSLEFASSFLTRWDRERISEFWCAIFVEQNAIGREQGHRRTCNWIKSDEFWLFVIRFCGVRTNMKLFTKCIFQLFETTLHQCSHVRYRRTAEKCSMHDCFHRHLSGKKRKTKRFRLFLPPIRKKSSFPIHFHTRLSLKISQWFFSSFYAGIYLSSSKLWKEICNSSRKSFKMTFVDSVKLSSHTTTHWTYEQSHPQSQEWKVSTFCDFFVFSFVTFQPSQQNSEISQLFFGTMTSNAD